MKLDEKLSAQIHHQRTEHYSVLSASAKVEIGNKEPLLIESKSAYIQLGVFHSLVSPEEIRLALIEAQSGSYLSQDDIVHFNGWNRR